MNVNDVAVAKQQSAKDFCILHTVKLVDGIYCPFCVNHIDNVCLHEHWGDCKGKIGIVFSDATNMALPMCDFHETDYYQRMDSIRAEYYTNEEDY